MNIEDRIISIVKKNLEKPQEVHPGSKLVDELGVDSFTKIMIISALEDEFNITVDETDFQTIITVADMINKLREKFPELGRS